MTGHVGEERTWHSGNGWHVEGEEEENGEMQEAQVERKGGGTEVGRRRKISTRKRMKRRCRQLGKLEMRRGTTA